MPLLGLELGGRVGIRFGERSKLLGGVILLAVGIALAVKVI